MLQQKVEQEGAEQPSILPEGNRVAIKRIPGARPGFFYYSRPDFGYSPVSARNDMEKCRWLS